MVRGLRAFTNWLLYTSVFAAGCAVSLCMATECLLRQAPPPFLSPLHGYVAGCTLLVYNAHFLIRKGILTKLPEDEVLSRADWSIRNRYWHIFVSFAGAVSAAGSLLFLGWKIIMASLALGALSFMYTLPLLPLGRQLRDWGIVKIITLTSVWTITTAILPMLYWQRAIADYPMEVAMRFVFMFTLCVAFDMRDMQADAETHIRTVPNLVGVARSRKLMYGGIIVFFFLSVAQYMRYGMAGRLIAELLTASAACLVLSRAGSGSRDTYYLGFVDGLMLLNGALTLFLYAV